MEYYVYKHTDKTNGKSYIGRTKNIKNRWKPWNYKVSTKFYKAILEHGWDNFTHEILKVCNETDADYWERYYIKKYNTIEDGYNLDSGGYKGKKQSPETIAKKSAFMKGKQQRKGHPAWNKGLKMSDEYRHKLSLAHIGQEGRGKKKVINLNTKEIFNSIKEACKKYGIFTQNLSKVVNGQRKKAGGFCWAFYEEE